ncbi:hypothetical protein BDF21DRAFT_423266 [Thamnidium elegans]|nr:hypothetical protein BDF21DRAFT_423266 [Thamnidium elegans]
MIKMHPLLVQFNWLLKTRDIIRFFFSFFLSVVCFTSNIPKDPWPSCEKEIGVLLYHVSSTGFLLTFDLLQGLSFVG